MRNSVNSSTDDSDEDEGQSEVVRDSVNNSTNPYSVKGSESIETSTKQLDIENFNMVVCVYCNERMKAGLLKAHVQNTHIDKKWYCEDCRVSLPTAYSLRRHKFLHHRKPKNNNNEEKADKEYKTLEEVLNKPHWCAQ